MQLRVESSAVHTIRKGHPWIYRDALKHNGKLKTGDIVDIVADDQIIARGLWDENSPIAVRLWCHGTLEPMNQAFFQKRLQNAINARSRWFDDSTTAYRLCNGEGDLIPGLVIDRYAHVAIVRTDSDATAIHMIPIVKSLTSFFRKIGITSVCQRISTGDSKLEVLSGDLPKASTIVQEHGVSFDVDVIHGQKTGAFLDQRENRQRIRELVRGYKTVLNLFSYSGGFSVMAALGGATHVTSVDIAHKAHASAQRSFQLNQLDPKQHTFATADVFAFLEQAIRQKTKFDVIVSDPPSFAKNEKSKSNAIKAYQRLHQLCALALHPGGLFCAASCSSHISMETFLETLDARTLKKNMRILEMYGQPLDHPTTPIWSEGRYLQFVVLQE